MVGRKRDIDKFQPCGVVAQTDLPTVHVRSVFNCDINGKLICEVHTDFLRNQAEGHVWVYVCDGGRVRGETLACRLHRVILSGSPADPANVNATMNNRTIVKPLMK